jgi:hypothetical protein
VSHIALLAWSRPPASALQSETQQAGPLLVTLVLLLLSVCLSATVYRPALPSVFPQNLRNVTQESRWPAEDLRPKLACLKARKRTAGVQVAELAMMPGALSEPEVNSFDSSRQCFTV